MLGLNAVAACEVLINPDIASSFRDLTANEEFSVTPNERQVPLRWSVFLSELLI